MSSDPEILIHESPAQGHETPFISGPYSFKGPDPCFTQPSTPWAAVYARGAAVAAAAAALAVDQAKGSPEGPTPSQRSHIARAHVYQDKQITKMRNQALLKYTAAAHVINLRRSKGRDHEVLHCG